MIEGGTEQQRNDPLLDWFRRCGRDLPWRDTADPHAVLVSETMSQQTQASRVTAHYEAFMKAATLDSLA